MAYNHLKEYLKAIDCFDEVLQLDQKYINALNNKGNSFSYFKEY